MGLGRRGEPLRRARDPDRWLRSARGSKGRYVLIVGHHTIAAERGASPNCRAGREHPAPFASAHRGGADYTSTTPTRAGECSEFPAYGDVESDWLGTATPGAGSDRASSRCRRR